MIYLESKKLDRPIGIKNLNRIKELLKINDELTGFYAQLHQHKIGLSENKEILKEVENKKIKKVMMPTIGKIMIPISTTDPKIAKMYKDMIRQYENSIKGIEGQIQHRLELFNEDVIFLFKFFASKVKEIGFDPIDMLPKPEEN